VNAAFTSGFPLEMLDDVGDVGSLARDARLLECIVEESSGGSHERVPGEILIVAGLFPDEHHLGVWATFTENCLCSTAPEVARAASASSALQRTKGSPLGHRDRRRHLCSTSGEEGEHEQHEEQEQKNSGEHLGDRERRAGDGREPQQRSNEPDEQKNRSTLEHQTPC
jgi:hypothetical protein